MAAELIQIYYHESQLPQIYPCAKPYFNEGLTVFFENELIRKLVSESVAEKVGVCSWKLRSKMKYFIGQPRPITQEVLETNYDVLAFTKNTKGHHMFAAAEQWHPGFLKTFDKILSAIGVLRPGEIKIPIYQNSHCTKTEIYKDYVKRYLSPAMEVMENDEEIKKLCMMNSRYSDLTNQSAEHLQKKIGINYYPMYPFILERLFSVYVQVNKIAVTHL